MPKDSLDKIKSLETSDTLSIEENKNNQESDQMNTADQPQPLAEMNEVDKDSEPIEEINNDLTEESLPEENGESSEIEGNQTSSSLQSQDKSDQPEELPEIKEAEQVSAMPVVASNGALLVEEEPVIEVVQTVPDASQPSGHREIVRSATLVMLGNLGSSLMGMVRQAFVAMNGSDLSGAFFGALSPAQKFNDFLVNGSVSGALIPTFNDYSAPEHRNELRRLVYTIVNLVILIMGGAGIIFYFIAPWLVGHWLEPGYSPELQLVTTQFAQIIFFSLLALGPFAVLQAALYARKEFGWAAFGITALHIGIIIGAILTSFVGARFLGNYWLAIGVLIGAAGEILLLLPGLIKQRLGYMFVLDLKQPALRRIIRLYGPVALSFLVSSLFAFLDQSLASQTPCASFMAHADNCGGHNYSAMNYSTTLIQFPIGLVAAALAFAVLPTLTSHAREQQMERFKDTLMMGFRLGLLLMIPAMAGLIVLGNPIIGAIFERRSFSGNDTILTATALQFYAYQLPFVAIDQLLINAFYARKNTITPVVVGIICNFCYLAVALPLYRTWGMPALPFAITVQNSLHAIILLILLRFAIGPLKVRQVVPALVKIVIATFCMAAFASLAQLGLSHISYFAHPSFISRVITVIVVGGTAAGIYFGLIILMKVEEVSLLKGAVLAKLGKK